MTRPDDLSASLLQVWNNLREPVQQSCDRLPNRSHIVDAEDVRAELDDALLRAHVGPRRDEALILEDHRPPRSVEYAVAGNECVFRGVEPSLQCVTVWVV